MKRVLAIAIFAVAVAAAGAAAGFPGKNGKIAFVRSGAIYLMEPNGTGLTAVTKESLTDAAQDPAWSPDGKQIAYARGCGIYVMNADGSGTRTVVKRSKALCAYEPAWAPDGARLVVVKRKDIQGTLTGVVWIVNADGSNQRPISQKRLTRHSFDDQWPQWSPDGRRIAFARYRGEGTTPDPGIWVMNADGSGQKQLTKDRRAKGENMPVWSPDGRSIAYMTRYQARGIGEDPRAIVIVDAITGNGRRLPTGKNRLDHNPGWAPDGSVLLFVDAGINAMRPDGTGRTRLTSGVGDESPDWQPLP